MVHFFWDDYEDSRNFPDEPIRDDDYWEARAERIREEQELDRWDKEGK